MKWSDLHTKVLSCLQATFDAREVKNIIAYLVREFTGQSVLRAQLDELTPELYKKVMSVVEKMAAGASMQVALGYAYFGEVKLQVTTDLLAPRPETEELVHWISAHVQPNQTVLDIGTGTGCIPLWLKHFNASLQVHGMDVSKEALSVAEKNAIDNQLEVNWLLGDVLQLDDTPFVVHHLISNPPYIPLSEKAEMSEVVLNNDPDLALFVPDNDPLLFYRKIAELGRKVLQKGGFLWFELHENYAKDTAIMVEKHGYKNVELKRDMQEKLRMLKAQKLD